MNTSSPMKQKTILNHGFMICSMELDLKKNKIKNCLRITWNYLEEDVHLRIVTIVT